MRRTSFQRKHMIWGSFTNGSADEQEKKSSAKLILERSQHPTLLKHFTEQRLSQYQCDKERKIALSISKLKAARYLEFGLEELVPSLWVESEREYDISAISEKDFKNLHPNDFKDLFLLNIQEKLNHMPKTDKTSLHTAVNMWIRNLVIRNRVGDLQLGIESYQTKINLERPNWDAVDYYFKEDYTIVPKQELAVVQDRNDQRKLIRLE
ncbi:hypothetical protein Tco_0120696 [Tanacetum coccineum]